jgi:hypothetical protein
VPFSEVRRLHQGLPQDCILVLDAAYAEYVRRNDYEAGVELVSTQDNVVMTRTFSKVHGLAALRLGWAYCPPAIADVLKYKSQLIMLILSYYIISGAHTYFGNTVTAISFVIFLIMFFFTPLFESYKLNYKDNLTPGIIPEAEAVPINTPVVEAVPVGNVSEISADTKILVDNENLSPITRENEVDKQILSGGKKGDSNIKKLIRR